MNAATRPRCAFVIPDRTWSTGKFEAAHQCPFPARAGGFCQRHNPTKMRETLLRRIGESQAQLARLDENIAQLTKKGEL